MANYAPLVIFAYNRSDHISRCLKAVNECVGAESTDLFIFSDGWKKDKDRDKIENVRKVIHDFEKDNNFRKVSIIESDLNKGLARSVREGVSDVITQYGKVIVLEDDLIAAKDLLKYMNSGLDYYQSVDKVWSIAGYSPYFKELRSYDKDVYMCERGCSWGWATWIDRWNSIDWEVTDYYNGTYDKNVRKQFMKAGYNLPYILDKQMNGQVDSWAIVFCYEAFKQGKYTVYPTVSRISNEGMDGSGTHCLDNDKWDVEIEKDTRNVDFIDPVLDKRIARGFYYFDADYPHIRVARTIWKWLKERFIHYEQ